MQNLELAEGEHGGPWKYFEMEQEEGQTVATGVIA